MIANTMVIQRVDNGWILSVESAGAVVKLVAETLDVLNSTILEVEWHAPSPAFHGLGEMPQTASR